MRFHGPAAAGSLIASFVSSLCCLGPAFAMLGISGGVLAARAGALRPILLVLAHSLLMAAFYFVYRRPRCGGRRSIILVWITAGVVVLTTAFPWYAQYF